MVDLLIIADDFTGALDTGVQFAARGAATSVITDPAFDFAGVNAGVRVLVLDAETRHLAPERAYALVRQAAARALDAGIPADRYLRASGAPTPGERFAGLLELPETPDPWDLYPEWFREELPEQLRNEDTLPLYMQRRPPLWLRTQTDHLPLLIAGLNRSGFAAERIASFPNALKIADARGSLYHTPEFLGGEFEIQDYSSQCIGWSCQAKPGERWWSWRRAFVRTLRS